MKYLLDKEYMSESYNQARKFGSKWLIIERIIGLGFIVAGISLFIDTHGETILPLALVAIGLVEFFSNYIKKYFWLRRHSKSKLMNAEVEINILESGIESRGPFSNGHFEWGGIEKIKRTPKGLLIWPQKGMYWYLPDRIAGKETIKIIESKIV